MPHSGVKPDFYRIYRIEQAADVVRSTQQCLKNRDLISQPNSTAPAVPCRFQAGG
jgi:hypothetical protein